MVWNQEEGLWVDGATPLFIGDPREELLDEFKALPFGYYEWSGEVIYSEDNGEDGWSCEEIWYTKEIKKVEN
jgi:hypothetical protein